MIFFFNVFKTPNTQIHQFTADEIIQWDVFNILYWPLGLPNLSFPHFYLLHFETQPVYLPHKVELLSCEPHLFFCADHQPWNLCWISPCSRKNSRKCQPQSQEPPGTGCTGHSFLGHNWPLDGVYTQAHKHKGVASLTSLNSKLFNLTSVSKPEMGSFLSFTWIKSSKRDEDVSQHQQIAWTFASADTHIFLARH